MKLKDLFDIEYGNKYDLNKLELSNKENGIAFVSRTRQNNGISAYVKKQHITPYKEGLMTVALGGSGLLTTYLQEKPFYTGQNVAVLSSKISLSKSMKLLYASFIYFNQFRYSAFGREANSTLKDLEIPDLLEAMCFLIASNKSRAEQSRAEQSRAEQSRAEQSRAEQSRAEQSRAEHTLWRLRCNCGVVAERRCLYD